MKGGKVPGTVLVVEDDRELRELVRRYLERAGHPVHSTASGAEAIGVLADGGVERPPGHPPPTIGRDTTMAPIDSHTTATLTTGLRVEPRAGEAYEIAVRGHRILVDQPADAGGGDLAPTPTELFAASLASCIAFYAGRYLTRHGYSRDGMAVEAQFDLATDRPARVAAVRLTLHVPAGVPRERWAALQAVASHCTVHNTLEQPAHVDITLR